MVGLHRLPCETPSAHSAEVSAKPTRWVLPATILGSSLSLIDGSVVNVALPAIQRDLQTQLATMQWVVNGYMLMLASLILLGGSAGDRFGRRRIFQIGLVGFALASLLCALAPSAGWLIVARLVQGIAAALLVPASLAILGSVYSGDARGRAIGTWAGAAALTTALGPPLGGWLVDAIGWRAIFFVNVPVAVLAWLLTLKIPADHRSETGQTLDWRGAGLAVLALGLIGYGLIALGQGQTFFGIVALTAAVPAAWFLIRTEAYTRAPMVPLWLFRNPAFAGTNGLTVLLYAALSGAPVPATLSPNRDPRLQRDRSRRRVSAGLGHHGRITISRRFGKTIWAACPTDLGTTNNRVRLYAPRSFPRRRKLLE